ncbi:PAS domain-containing sensor histidine kinase [Sporosarcina sp. Te-1]|uniref:PAS domain-containing sensor histidine kinase n=1 Tax=Sporosarcina sp. Te-1 TaxID=2818390 RepID=UPI001A9FB75F|nr:PAS domain-containing sensor histidine kinase [Sporosarcina sp. Te-1]QTD42496.1 PAS domain S-box protein [Sporosarcina sp. Te-1]
MENDNNVLENLYFILNDRCRPGIILEMDGSIYEMNEPFRVYFQCEQFRSIEDFIDTTSMRDWHSFTERSLASGQMQLARMPMNVSNTNDFLSVDAQLFYLHAIKKIGVIFELPRKLTSMSIKSYYNAFRFAHSFMMLVDEQGKICDVNERSYDFFNLGKDILKGRQIAEMEKLFPEVTANGLMEQLAIAKSTGLSELNITFERGAGDTRYYHITFSYEKDTNMFIVQIMDYTEREELEEKLAHSGTLSAVGQLAASIAHEIRNPMTTLKGFTQLLSATATEESLRYISVIEDEIKRMESILSEMLVLSKPVNRKKTTFSLDHLIQDMVSVLEPKALLENIHIVQNRNLCSTPYVYGDIDKLKQVILNLCKNAFEAMTAGGTLTITSDEEDGQLILSIGDTGKGMTLQQVNQVFMPFFSSKTGGTGLGLPFVLKTVEEHGGTISVESEVGRGTKFLLKFPRAANAAIELESIKQTVVS